MTNNKKKTENSVIYAQVSKACLVELVKPGTEKRIKISAGKLKKIIDPHDAHRLILRALYQIVEGEYHFIEWNTPQGLISFKRKEA